MLFYFYNKTIVIVSISKILPSRTFQGHCQKPIDWRLKIYIKKNNIYNYNHINTGINFPCYNNTSDM